VFACSPEDARQLQDHFAPHLGAHDLSHLPAFTAACRPCVAGANGTPFTFTTRPLPEGSREQAREAPDPFGRAVRRPSRGGREGDPTTPHAPGADPPPHERAAQDPRSLPRSTGRSLPRSLPRSLGSDRPRRRRWGRWDGL